MQVGIKKAEREDKTVLVHLWDLYSYDFSVYNSEDVTGSGEYEFYYRDEYFDNPDKECYFILVEGKYAGFVSVSNICYALTKPNDKSIVDFFVMRKYRKGGVGRKAAYLLFDMYPTRWEVAQYDNNEISKQFWERIITDYTNNNYQLRTVIQPDFTLQAITFDSSMSKDVDTVNNILQHLDDTHTIKLHSRPDEDVKNTLIRIAEAAYPTIDNVYVDMRRDMRYQDVLTIGTVNEILGFLMFTSIDGSAEITFLAINPKYQNRGLATVLLGVFKQQMMINGFTKIVVDFDTITKSETFTALYNFYLKLGFHQADDRGELLEYIM